MAKKIAITGELLKKYIRDNEKHSNYDTTVKLHNEIKVHAEGLTPEKLIAERRPGESEYIYKYRKAIYQPKTKTPIRKVINTIGKIRRSPDWSIKYDDSQIPKVIHEEETLQKYCEEKFPGYTSLTKWYFEACLYQHLTDPNAVALVHLLHDELPDNKNYVKPVITIFNSEQVIEYKEGEFAVLLSKEKSSYTSTDGGHKYDDGSVYYVVTPQTTYKLEQRDANKTSFNITEFVHPFEKLPAFKLGAIEKDKYLYESRIAGMIPSLNVAVTIYSDKQAEIVQHVHSEKWIYQTQSCKKCGGAGKVPVQNSVPIECSDCKGAGVVNTSPYSNMIINPAALGLGEKALPTPPAGYIQKSDVAMMVKVISEEIKAEIWDAYSAVNMEFLMETPLAESGKAKEVDQDNLNHFIYSVAEDAVSVMDRAYYFIAQMRYSYLIKDEKQIKAMCPKVPVPEKYDLLSSNYYLEKFKAARDAKVNPLLLAEMEIEYSTKEFYNNPEVTQMMQCMYDLNPLPGTTEEDKMVMLQNGGIDKKDYIISSNIFPFVKRAMQENPNFYKLSLKEQQKIVSGYADEKIKANSIVANVHVEE